VRRLGSLEVFPIGFGAMVLSPGLYGPVDDDAAAAALDAALATSNGVGRLLIDSSDSYGPDYHNERLLGRLAASQRDSVVISTKFGFRPPAGEPRHSFPVGYAFGELAVNASPHLVRGYALGSLARLSVERLDLLYPHFPDPIVPIAETVGAMAELVAEGLVAHLGVSNVTASQLADAVAVHPIAAVQVEWSMWNPIDPELLSIADAHGIGVVAWGPLGSGFLTGTLTQIGGGDYRNNVPRLAGPNLEANADRYAPIRGLATEWGVSPSQLALAWLMHQHAAAIPIPGSRTPLHIRENYAAVDIALDDEQWRELDVSLSVFRPEGATLFDRPSGRHR
jgi:aryl-alcohol dehydrogenase-like predicted oxidoreductase